VKPSKKVLVYIPSESGGIAEYAACQCKSMISHGVGVICLVSPSFLGGRDLGFETTACLLDSPSVRPRLLKKIGMLWRMIGNRLILAWQIVKHRPDLVLLDTYVEYFSPLWILPHWFLARVVGIKYAANLHDPVRNFVVGPTWWHNLSVGMAYLPLDFVLVHHELTDASIVPSEVRVFVVPHGLYEVSNEPRDASSIRSDWGVQAGQKIFLSFGYVRDGKNLDLAIRALVDVQEAFLAVAGSVASAKDKPFEYYWNLAAELGVLERCRFFEGFVTDQEIGRYFAGADYILLTYSSSFYSQSGVLSIAAHARKPILASASPSPMIDAVNKFQLGITVPPDSSVSIAEGMRGLLTNSVTPRWEDYEAAASWDTNVRIILEGADLSDVTAS
jgi:glycosyltransferase involved in cell wall biosynthesis